MTLIDVVVGTALVVIIFLALFGILRVSIVLSTLVKNESTALSIADSQMEYIRSLPYTSVGTVGGIPAGPVAQDSTTIENGTPYDVRTLIEYNDDTQDYKIIKVTVSYSGVGGEKQYSLVSNYAPIGLESAVGGALQIIVVNATGSPVPGASVEVVNASTTPTVNLTTFTNAEGIVDLPGATPSTGYEITVTKSGYSTAQTYARTDTNQNPTPGYLTVTDNLTTSSTFAIDALASLTVHTYSPPTTGVFSDNFADASKLATLSNTQAGGDSLQLASGAGSGSAVSITTTPQYLGSWGVASSTMSVPAGDSAVVHVVDANGNPIPDSVLPGNAAGFTSFPVDLSGVSTTTYPSLALSADLESNSTSSTPTLTGWSITYQETLTPLPNVAFTLTGTKTIGTTGSGAPIYKTVSSNTTDSTGTSNLSLEWDSYSLAVPSHDVMDACSAPPYALLPGTSTTDSLILGPPSTNMILVTVTDGSGNVVPGASVTLSRSGYTSTVTTSSCGNAYFGNLNAASDYSVEIAKTGYTTNTVTNVSVSGQTFYADAF